MSEGRVIEFRRRGGWARALADGHLDRLRSRIRWDRIRARALSVEIDELTRQFTEEDLRIQSGPRLGEPLRAAGRAVRLNRLALLHREYWAAMDSESHLRAVVESLDMPGTKWNEKERPSETSAEYPSEEVKDVVRSLLGVARPAGPGED